MIGIHNCHSQDVQARTFYERAHGRANSYIKEIADSDALKGKYDEGVCLGGLILIFNIVATIHMDLMF